MAFRHTYTTSEVRAIMQNSEGATSPVTQAPAHARVLHAKSHPGPKATGTSHDLMKHRVTKGGGESNNQFKKRGGAAKTSAFRNVLQQAEAVCQALNTKAGQKVMKAFDAPSNADKDLRATLTVAGILESSFMPGAKAPGMSSIAQGDASVTKGDAGGVQIILDRGPNASSFVVQTCYPLAPGTATSYTVRIGTNGGIVAQG